MDKIKRVRETCKRDHSFFLQNSKVYPLFVEMEKKTYENAILGKKINSKSNGI